jgi:hypothetical protein
MTTTNKFLAFATADIQERIDIKDELLEVYIDPVYENGLQFSGEVLICGVVKDNTDEGTLGSILQEYLKEYVEFARIKKVQLRGKPERVVLRLQKVG